MAWYRWRANPAANAGQRARQKPSLQGKDSMPVEELWAVFQNVLHRTNSTSSPGRYWRVRQSSKKRTPSFYPTNYMSDVWEWNWGNQGGRRSKTRGVEVRIGGIWWWKRYFSEMLSAVRACSSKSRIRLNPFQCNWWNPWLPWEGIVGLERSIGLVFQRLNGGSMSQKQWWHCCCQVRESLQCPPTCFLNFVSLHEGMTSLSFDFGQAYPDFCKDCLVLFTQFLENVYRESVYFPQRSCVLIYKKSWGYSSHSSIELCEE